MPEPMRQERAYEAKLCTCGIALNRSVLRLHHKSCTSCSLKAGQHVFHPRERFTVYLHKDRSNTALESQCDRCRAAFQELRREGSPATQTNGGLELIPSVVYLGTELCTEIEARE